MRRCIIIQVHCSPLTCSFSTVGPLLSLQWRRVEARGRSSSAPLHLPLTYTTPTYRDTPLVEDSSGAEGNKRQPIMSASYYLHNEDGRQIIIEVNQGYLCLMLFIYLKMLMDDICPSYINFSPWLCKLNLTIHSSYPP